MYDRISSEYSRNIVTVLGETSMENFRESCGVIINIQTNEKGSISMDSISWTLWYEFAFVLSIYSNDLICSGTFKEGTHDGYLLKAFSSEERDCYEFLQNDILKDFVPKYNGLVKDQDGKGKMNDRR